MPTVQELADSYVTSETLDQELECWMRDVTPYRLREVPAMDRDHAAFLVVDMTCPFVDEGMPLSSPAARAIVTRVNDTAAAFRAANRPVIWLVQGHHSVAYDRGALLNGWWQKPILEGTPDVEMATGIDVNEQDKIIMKRRYSGFHQTDLDLTLRCLEVRDVVVCGVLTNVCPYLTAFDAFMRGYQVYYPADLTGSLNRELHVGALRTVAGWCGHVVRASEIAGWLKGEG